MCVGCLADGDCPSTSPLCATDARQCIVCNENAGCGGAQPFCVTSVAGGACHQCRAGQEAVDCRDPARPFCTGGACVATPPAVTSAQIQAVRNAPVNTSIDLAIRGATVTYLRPSLGDAVADPAGFFVQAEAKGPAVFVAVDPATLGTEIRIGNVMDLNVTSTAVVAGQKRATSVTEVRVIGSGANVADLAHDISLETAIGSQLDLWDGRLVSVQGMVLSVPLASGAAHRQLRLATDGLSDGTLRLRTGMDTAAALQQTLGLAPGCNVTLAANPLWRIDADLHVLFLDALEVTSVTCPAPGVESAVAISPTEVLVTFTRPLDVTSVDADGDQFTLSEGLAVEGAQASGRQVVLTTAAQMPGMTYTMTVAASLMDLVGTAMPAPVGVPFSGFIAPAQLVFSEVQPHLPSNNDLIELRALTAGSAEGIRLMYEGTSRTAPLVTLPRGLVLAAGDVLVIHLNIPGLSETTDKAQVSSDTVLANSDAAWDIYTSDRTGVDHRSNRVLRLETAAGETLDGVPFMGTTALGVPAPVPMGFLNALKRLQEEGLWAPEDCAGAVCTSATLMDEPGIAVPWSALADGQSLQRAVQSRPDMSINWAPGPASIGQ
ncbi:MAG: Ig-like domain-containing protein [Myxococcaceae bacterium]